MAREMRIEQHEQYIDAVYTYEVDLTVLDQELGVTSSAVTWSTDDGCVTIGTSSFTSSIASAPITANSVGTALIKLAITTGSNDAPVFYFRVKVLDPNNDLANVNWR